METDCLVICELEERALAAWPALETVASDRWILRAAGGYTRRANSVHPLGEGRRALSERIREAEEFYRERGLPPIVKLTAASRPLRLDEELAARGYKVEMRTGVHVGCLRDVAEPNNVRVREEITGRWLGAFHEMSQVSHDRRALHEQILRGIAFPTGFATMEDALGNVGGCALGVVQGHWMGVFDVVIAGQARRRGLGERLMLGLMAWGRAVGALQAYLQVTADNAVALALYKKLEFQESYGYWYRVLR